MDTVPKIISCKDLLYLEDMFKWNYNAVKQVNNYIDRVKDKEIKELFNKIINMHKSNMEFIIKILKNEDFLEEDEDNE